MYILNKQVHWSLCMETEAALAPAALSPFQDLLLSCGLPFGTPSFTVSRQTLKS